MLFMYPDIRYSRTNKIIDKRLKNMLPMNMDTGYVLGRTSSPRFCIMCKPRLKCSLGSLANSTLS